MFRCHPNHPNKGYTLDLAFSSSNILKFLHNQDVIVPLDKEHHYSATFAFEDKNKCFNYKSLHYISRYNFKKINSNLLTYYLHSINWIQVLNFNILNLNECVDLFYSLLYDLIDIVVPKFKFKQTNFPAWHGTDLIQCIIDKKIAHAEWLECQDHKLYTKFKKLRAKCKYNNLYVILHLGVQTSEVEGHLNFISD